MRLSKYKMEKNAQRRRENSKSPSNNQTQKKHSGLNVQTNCSLQWYLPLLKNEDELLWKTMVDHIRKIFSLKSLKAEN